MKKYDINLLIDVHSENQWAAKNLNYFQDRCKNVAIHLGSWCDPKVESWPTIIGEHQDHIVTTKVLHPGKPEWKPDVIIVDLGTKCGDHGARIPRYKDIFTAVYFADLHRRISPRRPSGDREHKAYAACFNVAFGRQKWVIESYPNGYWLPHDFHKSWIPPDDIDRPKFDICFQGTIDNERRNLLNMLAKKFRVYIGGDKLSRRDYIQKLYNGKFTFNLTKTPLEINGKVFEMLAAGRVLFTNRVETKAGLEKLFENGKHLVIYEDYEDLIIKMEHYLKYPDEAKKIAIEGKKEVYKNHCSEVRVEQMLEVIEKRRKK